MALNNYSNDEKEDMLAIYFKSNRSTEAAALAYEEQFPERRQPNQKHFRFLVTNLLAYGSFVKPNPKTYTKNNEARDAIIMENVRDDPTTSVRKVGEHTAIPKSSVHRTLIKHGFHPYKPRIVQGLQGNDFNRRITFSQWFITKCQQIPNFQSKVLWTDETRFTNCEIFNKHNYHCWDTENPHNLEERRLQTRFGFNVWCGIIGNLKCIFNLRLTIK
jgi:hypothetical protein